MRDLDRLTRAAHLKVRTLNKMFTRPLSIEFGSIEYETSTTAIKFFPMNVKKISA